MYSWNTGSLKFNQCKNKYTLKLSSLIFQKKLSSLSWKKQYNIQGIAAPIVEFSTDTMHKSVFLWPEKKNSIRKALRKWWRCTCKHSGSQKTLQHLVVHPGGPSSEIIPEWKIIPGTSSSEHQLQNGHLW